MDKNHRRDKEAMLPAGKYYIGDPCYVLDEKNGFDWSDILDETEYFDEGLFSLNGKKCIVFSTNYGDGIYPDYKGNNYCVDAGCIGAIPIELLPNEQGKGLGHIHEFEQDFYCHSEDNCAHLYFGNVHIVTDGSDEEDDDEDDYEDEYFDSLEDDDVDF